MMRWRFFLVLVVAGLLAGALSTIQSLHTAWRGGYTGLGQILPANALLKYHSSLVFNDIRTLLFASDARGLPPVKIFIGEQEQKKLIENLPENIKDWQRAFLIYPDNDINRVKIRFRGDNPANWIGRKKSWVLKTRKKALLNGSRRFIYPAPQEPDFLANHLSYLIATKVGVLSPKSRLVDLKINEQSQGIYAEIENIDETLLRKNNVMPVNIYKGEQYNSERMIYTSNYLFNNPNLWTKKAVFNRVDEADNSDLRYFLNALLHARESSEAKEKLEIIARHEDWARFAAYQVLVQSWHNSDFHNQRLVADPWRGTIKPIVHDTVMHVVARPFKLRMIEKSNSLLDLYSRIPGFTKRKHELLWLFLEQGALSEAADEIEAMIPELAATYSRDTSALETALFSGGSLNAANVDDMSSLWRDMVDRVRDFETFLKNSLAEMPQLSWRTQGAVLDVTVSGPFAGQLLHLTFDEMSQIPDEVAWDRDGDRILSGNDVMIPMTRRGRTLSINAALFANRLLLSAGNSASDISSGAHIIAPTTFSFVADKPFMPVSVRSSNMFTDEDMTVPYHDKIGVPPNQHNQPVLNETTVTTEIWSGKIRIEETLVVDRPIKIMPGTEIFMSAGKSLVFTKRIEAVGSKEQPIIIKPAQAGSVWGAFAVSGPNVSGSKLAHIVAYGGSEALVNSVYYSGMINIHEGAGHELSHFHFYRNFISDDLLHIIYADKVSISNCKLSEARSDALDIDMSEVVISDCVIDGSGNDAIDLMSSKVLITNSELRDSGDKGVSIGEKSRAEIQGVVLEENMIGVEIKDQSIAYIKDSSFLNNTTHMNGYGKNWRYVTGGNAVAVNSRFKGGNDLATADRQSSIAIFAADLKHGPANVGKNILIEPSADDLVAHEVIAYILQEFPMEPPH